MRQSRKSGCVKALKAGVTVDAGNMTDDLEAFWNILAGILMEKHHKKPVHTVKELQLLHSRFPEQIKLYVAREGGNVVAGALIYDMGHVVHTQYLASSAEGKRDGALDLLLHSLRGLWFLTREGFSRLRHGLMLNMMRERK